MANPIHGQIFREETRMPVLMGGEAPARAMIFKDEQSMTDRAELLYRNSTNQEALP